MAGRRIRPESELKWVLCNCIITPRFTRFTLMAKFENNKNSFPQFDGASFRNVLEPLT